MTLFLRMDWQQAQKEMVTLLLPLYGDREAALITDWVLESLSGWKKIDRFLNRSTPLTDIQSEKYRQNLHELLAHRPVQYVLHEAWFAGRRFEVDENVLIPRPETEELVDWVTETLRPAPPHADRTHPILLDVGTGSGCIAITLSLNLPGAEIHALDVSPGALTVAQHNAMTLQASVHFHQINFLDPNQWDNLPTFDYIISNPPYIPVSDAATMSPHVLQSEPHLALFVENDDPLLFYKTLAAFANKKLSPGGSIFAEIHEEMGPATAELFSKAGFQDVILKKDMQGKDRMIKASR